MSGGSILCIGGIDPAGRAGLSVDARAVWMMGGHPLTVPTALTFQTGRALEGFHPVPVDVVRRQLDLLARDEVVSAIKIGQIGSAGMAAAVLEAIDVHFPSVPVVLDTPLANTAEHPLIDPADVQTAYAGLLARASVATPNAPEVLALSSLAQGVDVEALSESARQGDRVALETLGAALPARAVLLKGGHLDGDLVTDVLLVGKDRHPFSSTRVPGMTRGTGCRLASAIATGLGRGEDLIASVRLARAWLLKELRDGR
jgi:hydroxymethylpyrimidine/phosphomethylpyrimidine kinase